MKGQNRLSEADELREVTREAHAAMKDLRAAIKDARRLWAEVRAETADDVTDSIAVIVKAGLDGYGKAIDTAIVDVEAKIDERFGRIMDILLGEDGGSKKKGKPTVEELVLAKDITQRMTEADQ